MKGRWVSTPYGWTWRTGPDPWGWVWNAYGWADWVEPPKRSRA